YWMDAARWTVRPAHTELRWYDFLLHVPAAFSDVLPLKAWMPHDQESDIQVQDPSAALPRSEKTHRCSLPSAAFLPADFQAHLIPSRSDLPVSFYTSHPEIFLQASVPWRLRSGGFLRSPDRYLLSGTFPHASFP